MSGAAENGGREPAGELVVVHVEDQIDHALAGHPGHHYKSPPQSYDEALALVGVLLGYASGEPDGCRRWACPIAGGRRSVWLESQPRQNGVRQSSK